MRQRLIATLIALLLAPLPAGGAEGELPNLPAPIRSDALTGARIVVADGMTIEEGTIVLRDGVIQAVGERVQIPPDARVWDLGGKTVYPGLIDAWTRVGLPPEPKEGRRSGRRGGGPPQRAPQPPPAPEERGPVHELSRVRPEHRAADAIRTDAKSLEAWRDAGFTTVGVVPGTGIFRGTAALLNLGDGGPGGNLVLEDTGQVVGFDHGGFAAGEYPTSVIGVIALVRQTFLDAGHYAADWESYRSDPSGRGRPDVNRALQALGPALGGAGPIWFDADGPLGLVQCGGIRAEFELRAIALGSGEEYRHLDWVREAAMPLVLPVDFPAPPHVGDSGPALDVTTDDLRRWRRAPENPALLEQAGIEFALTAHGLDGPADLAGKVREAIDRGLDPDAALAALTRVPARLLGAEARLGAASPGKIANLVVADGKLFDEETRVLEVWIDGRRYPTSAAEEKEEPEAEPNDAAGKEPDAGTEEATARETEEEATDEAREIEIPWAPAPGALESPPAVVVRGATIWTSGPKGRLEEADLLVEDSTIVAVGRVPEPPAGAVVIDGTGRHVTPGLIDAHSHSATASSVNEAFPAVSAETRISDALDPDSPILYRLLAGGLTTANVLHGSANPIGGQNAVIKIRTGMSPAGLLVPDAPAGIKFALGENPKHSNFGSRTRFPQTRMGVEAVIRQTFLAARDYAAAWKRYRAQEKAGVASGPPPRRDLQLEAVAEILAGERAIHAHSYRQDEILALLLLADEFDVRIAAFQHVLEGYKVGREIAAHGVGASTFSDWWAYKFEVYDAIPYNGALMYEHGVVVSYNSDSNELARRLNLEAAKAIKYGGVPPSDALKFVTLNPAIQLGLQERIGSLEPGKEGDFVVWSGDPLSTRSVVDQTWVGGELYFDRETDRELRRALAAEREALIEAARAAGGGKKGKGPGKGRRGHGEEVTR